MAELRKQPARHGVARDAERRGCVQGRWRVSKRGSMNGKRPATFRRPTFVTSSFAGCGRTDDIPSISVARVMDRVETPESSRERIAPTTSAASDG